jgi:hypothetical protein
MGRAGHRRRAHFGEQQAQRLDQLAPRVRKSCPSASLSTSLQPNAHLQPLPARQVDVGDLPRHERGLPLGQDQHPGWRTRSAR